MTYYFQTKVWIRILISPDPTGSGINWNISERERERMIVLYQLNCQKVLDQICLKSVSEECSDYSNTNG